MVKISEHNPASQRPGESTGVEVVTTPGLIAGPLAKAERGEGETLATAAAPRSEPDRGRYRRVFACATGPLDTPNEKRPS